jgi:IS5 family transposase
LEWLNNAIKWEIFNETLDVMKPDKSKGGKGGRPAYPLIMMFKVLILQSLYNVSDEQMEYQINDRLSWKRFLGLTMSDKAPDRTTIWEFRELLTNSGSYDRIFTIFNQQMKAMNVITRKGSIIDASFEDAPRPRNSKEENETLKNGEIPKAWEANKHIKSQKDMEGEWAKKNEEVHFGYKDHIKCDNDSKMITECRVTPANDHDSQIITALVDEEDKVVWADSAYVGERIEEALLEINPEIELNINEKGYRNHPLTLEQKADNREKSKVRARVEHVFGYMTNSMGGMTVRCIGIVRAECIIVMKNLTYNISRYTMLRRKKAVPAM